jgi:hypothetical protein
VKIIFEMSSWFLYLLGHNVIFESPIFFGDPSRDLSKNSNNFTITKNRKWLYLKIWAPYRSMKNKRPKILMLLSL